MTISSMYQEYLKLKEQHQDDILLYHLGDFYEAYGDDAMKMSRDLGLTLTGRNFGLEERIPMCGVPYHSLGEYVEKLIENGHTVIKSEILGNGQRYIEHIYGKEQSKIIPDKISINQEALDKLSKPRKELVEKVLQQLVNGTAPWQQGWVSDRARNGVTNKPYRGINAFITYLDQTANERKDPRYYTFNQANAKGWMIKKGSHGIPIEKYLLYDIETKKEATQEYFTTATAGMTQDEKDEWKQEHIRLSYRSYTVHSAENIEGVSEYKKEIMDQSERDNLNCELDNLIKNWECPVNCIKNSEAFYNYSSDQINLPLRESFYNQYEFYSTALHEMAHSTGHESRLNRHLEDRSKYALEELRAEMSSMFLGGNFNLTVQESQIKNHSSYINSWYEEIAKDPNSFIEAVKDADKITNYISKVNEKINGKQKINTNKPREVEVISDRKEKVDNFKPIFKSDTVLIPINAKQYVGTKNNFSEFIMPIGSKYEGCKFYHNAKYISKEVAENKTILNLKCKDDFTMKLYRGQSKFEADDIFELSISDFKKALEPVKRTQKDIEIEM